MCSRAISSLYIVFFYSRIMKGYFKLFVLNNGFLIKKKVVSLFSSQISAWEALAFFLLIRRVMAVNRQIVIDSRFFFFPSFFSLSFRENTLLSSFLLFFNCNPYVFYCLFSSLDLLEKFLMLSI